MPSLFKKLFLFALLLMLAFTNCKNSDQQATQSRPQRLPLVTVMPARIVTMTTYIDITGNVQANIVSEVKAPVNGVIEKLFARENERVEKDQIIAVINPGDRLALIASNQIIIRELELQLEETDKNSAEHQSLQDQLSKAKSNLNYSKTMYQTVPVICPMSGLVTERWADEGSQIGLSDRIITISDMSSLVIKAEVNEKYFGAIRKGNNLPVILAAYPNDTLEGVISLVYPHIDRATRSVKFDIRIQGFNKALFPGMMAQIRIPVARNENAVSVPDDAILTSPNLDYFLFTVDSDSIAHRCVVTTGITEREYVEITSGLAENEKVVVAGQQMLKDKAKVRIVK